MAVPKQHRAAQVVGKDKLQVNTVDTPTPGDSEVLIKVSASGVCYSDHFAAAGIMGPGAEGKIVPGHEVVGHIVAAGSGVAKEWAENTLVGLGWNGGYCGTCANCRKGDFTACAGGRVTGITQNGGHAEFVVADQSALVRLPEDAGMSHAEMAPLLCAGNTVWEALQCSGAKGGDVVIVSGLGGLGHLAIQYARKLGFYVVAVSGSPDKEELAKKLGAHVYFSAKDDLKKEIKEKLGGAAAAIATAPSAEAISSLVPLLGRRGMVVVVGVPTDGKPIEVNPMDLISSIGGVRGMTCGYAAENEASIRFSVQHGVKSMVTEYPLDKAQEAYDDVMGGKPRFRNVIVFK